MPNDKLPEKLPARPIQKEIKEEILQVMGYNGDTQIIREKLIKKLSELVRRTPQLNQLKYSMKPLNTLRTNAV